MYRVWFLRLRVHVMCLGYIGSMGLILGVYTVYMGVTVQGTVSIWPLSPKPTRS